MAVLEAREFVDTNVLVYAYEPDAGDRHLAARELVARLGGSRRAAISVQVLQEFHVTMTRRMAHAAYTPEVARARLQMLSRWPVHSPSADDVVAAAEISAESQISLWDAMILRSAARMGCAVLWSEDLNPGQVISGVRIQSPFV